MSRLSALFLCAALSACASAAPVPPPESATAVPDTAAALPKELPLQVVVPTGEGSLDVAVLTVAGTAGNAAAVRLELAGISTEAALFPDGQFVGTIACPPGSSELIVKVAAPDGRTATRKIPLRNVPPDRAILGDFPEGPKLVTEPSVNLEGTVAGAVKTLTVNGEPVPLDQFRFRYTALLTPDLPNVLRFEAVTGSGIVYEKTAVLLLDRTPPAIEIEGLAEFNRDAVLSLRVRSSEPLESLELSGAAVPLGPDRRSAELQLTLLQGLNEVSLTATDPAGQSTALTRTVTFDTKPPEISCTGSATGKPSIRCEADEPLMRLAGNGAEGTINGSSGTVELPNLPEGTHTVAARAWDRAGNESAAAVQVVIDRTAPVIHLHAPAGLETLLPTFAVAGTTEPGAAVIVNGVPARQVAGLFSRTLTLTPGKHDLTVTATDGAGNTSTSTVTAKVESDPKLFLRVTGFEAKSRPAPLLDLRQPADNAIYGGRVPFLLPRMEGEALTVVLNGLPLLDAAPLPQENQAGLDGELPPAALQDGVNRLTVTASAASGDRFTLERQFTVDRTPPEVRIENLSDGDTLAAYSPKVSVKDSTPVNTSWTLNGRPFDPANPLKAGPDTLKTQVICAEAADAARNRATDCRRFTLTAKPFAFRRGEDPRVAAQAPLRRDLLQPMLSELVESGVLADLTIGNLMLLADAAEAFYPSLGPDFSELKTVAAEQARSGELAGLLRAVLGFHRQGHWDEVEQLMIPLLAAGNGRRAPVAEFTLALDGLLPRTSREVTALDRLLAADIGKGRTVLDLLPAVIASVTGNGDGVWQEFWSRSAAASRGRFAVELDQTGRALAKPGSDGRSAFERLEPVYRRLLGTDTGAPVPLLVATYLEAVGKLPDARDREAFRELAGEIIGLAFDPDLLRALGRALDTPHLEANNEWIRRSIERGDFYQLMKTLSDVSLEPDPRDSGSPVLASSVKALSRLWAADRRSPGRTYAGSVLEAAGELFQPGEDGISSVQDFLTFFAGINPNDRRMLGRVFWQSSRKEGRPADPFRENVSTDAERLMRLFTIANSPLNCGAPVPFTTKVVPLNVPGLPQLFPTDNLVTEMFEASTHFEPETVIQLARLMPKVIQILRMGDMFCEPEIVKDLLSDADVLEANLNHPLLPDLLKLGRRMVLRKQHNGAVRMLTAISDSGVLQPAIPFLATLYKTDRAEDLYEFMVRQKSWKLVSGNGDTAFDHSLKSGAVFLARRPDGHVAGADLADRFQPLFGSSRIPQTARAMGHIARRIAGGESRAGLGRPDLIFARWLAADPEATGTRQLAALLDGNRDNGDFVALVEAFPVRTEKNSPVLDNLPELASRFERSGLFDNAFETGRKYLAINSASGRSLDWILRNAFRAPAPESPTPFLRAFRSAGPLLDHIGRKEKVWRQWAVTSELMKPLLASARSWTRPRSEPGSPAGRPHLLRVRGLLSKAVVLPAPDGEGLLIDRAVRVAARAQEKGMGRSLIEALDLLELNGYLDRRSPSISGWISTTAD